MKAIKQPEAVNNHEIPNGLCFLTSQQNDVVQDGRCAVVPNKHV